MIEKKHLAAICSLCLGLGLSGLGLAQTPAPVQLSLDNRVFLDTTSNYDPVYGLSRVGVIKEHVLTWLPLNKSIVNYTEPKIIGRNFQVYSAHSDVGATASANITLPVIGIGGSASTDTVVYANMEDIDEVTAPRNTRSTCEIWALIPHSQVSAGDTIIITDHAILSKVAYGSAKKQDANAKAGIGSFFGIGGDAYRQEDNSTSVPLISVTGDRFTVSDPKTFCKSTPRTSSVGVSRIRATLPTLARFTSINDLGEPNLKVKVHN